MDLELTNEERELLLETLEARRQELHPEIRRCMDHNYKDALRRNLACCEGLLEQMKAIHPDVD